MIDTLPQGGIRPTWGYSHTAGVEALAQACPLIDETAGQPNLVPSFTVASYPVWYPNGPFEAGGVVTPQPLLGVLAWRAADRWGNEIADGGSLEHGSGSVSLGKLQSAGVATLATIQGFGALVRYADLDEHSSPSEIAGGRASYPKPDDLPLGATVITVASGEGWAHGLNSMWPTDSGAAVEVVSFGDVPEARQQYASYLAIPPSDLADCVEIMAARWRKNVASPGAGMGGEYDGGQPMMSHILYGLNRTLRRFAPPTGSVPL